MDRTIPESAVLLGAKARARPLCDFQVVSCMSGFGRRSGRQLRDCSSDGYAMGAASSHREGVGHVLDPGLAF